MTRTAGPPTIHISVHLEQPLLDAIDDIRYGGRYPNRNACLVALLSEAVAARQKQDSGFWSGEDATDTDEGESVEDIALERVVRGT
jgi:Arc/MetJ-type ribon-helix-helix transcriptional regulator